MTSSVAAQRTAAVPLLDALLTAQSRHSLFPPPADAPHGVVVGVSGGLDSVCLLHALAQLAPMWRLALHVAHVDHGLRADSSDDATWVATLAHTYGLPFHLHRLDGTLLLADAAGVEAAARQARYAALARIACAIGDADLPATVAVAHHQDDQAETVLMHLITGSGLSGLGGMPWVAHLDQTGEHGRGPVRLVRPFLGVSRAELVAYATQHGLMWREDPTNRDPARLRNRIRHQVLPLLATLNPGVTHTLARSAELLAAEADRAARLDAAALDALTCEAHIPERIVLDWQGVLASHPATRRGVVRAALARLGADLRATGADAIARLLDDAQRRPGAGGPYPLPGGLAWTLLAGDGAGPRFSLHRAGALPCAPAHPTLPPGFDGAIPVEGTLAVTPSWQLSSALLPPATLPERDRLRAAPWSAYLDADAAAELRLTTPAAGMRLAPLGMHGKRRTLGDIFTDRKIAPALRAMWPVVARKADGEVIWLCGLAISHHARVHAGTAQVRRLVWSRPVGTEA